MELHQRFLITSSYLLSDLGRDNFKSATCGNNGQLTTAEFLSDFFVHIEFFYLLTHGKIIGFLEFIQSQAVLRNELLDLGQLFQPRLLLVDLAVKFLAVLSFGYCLLPGLVYLRCNFLSFIFFTFNLLFVSGLFCLWVRR